MMERLTQYVEKLIDLAPSVAAIVVVIVLLWVINRLLQRRLSELSEQGFKRPLITLVISLAGVLAVILLLPVSESSRGQLLSLLGILLSAAIALSSTAFLSNIMAGFMLRSVRIMRPGRFLEVGEYFGRVTQRGLFHVQIQGEDRNLISLPNMYLAITPMKNYRDDGVIVSAEVSLGYDAGREQITNALSEAAIAAGLTEPYVHVMELGNFAVTYRINGLLEDVKLLISTRSKLREMVLDTLHGAGIEIVSPTFMNTRALDPDQPIRPDQASVRPQAEKEPIAEALIFDKADQAESLERLRQSLAAVQQGLEQAQVQLKETESPRMKREIEARKSWLTTRLEALQETIQEREKDNEQE
jgi:small conductance mechanosensitive channel